MENGSSFAFSFEVWCVRARVAVCARVSETESVGHLLSRSAISCFHPDIALCSITTSVRSLKKKKKKGGGGTLIYVLRHYPSSASLLTHPARCKSQSQHKVTLSFLIIRHVAKHLRDTVTPGKKKWAWDEYSLDKRLINLKTLKQEMSTAPTAPPWKGGERLGNLRMTSPSISQIIQGCFWGASHSRARARENEERMDVESYLYF